ncbi:MAG: hypothetical protein COV47_06190 [Candidatus Diapherotrites archaeon CG11_big_fil_rev_8_21_14_0_20_37_9]|nr:MAG: hypothetical protein COV47_06190 [Candidatus Diapherotrites archaeon CG11_big_fil_rev_8_21_14_0_20_37_9]
MAKSIANESRKLIVDKIKEKLSLAKDAPYIAYLLVEFALTLIIVGAIAIYLDGRFNQIEFPFNLFLFGIIVYGVLHFYNYTAVFRKIRGIKREASVKQLILEFAIFMILVASAYIYQDPLINTLPSPFNIIIFLAVLAVPITLYIKERFWVK